MKIAIASDHGGFKIKEWIVHFLSKQGYSIIDLGVHKEESVDYPDYAKKVGLSVSSKKVDRGILVCGTGIGMSIAANKINGVRAAVTWDVELI